MSSLGTEEFTDEIARVLSKISWILREYGQLDSYQKAAAKGK